MQNVMAWFSQLGWVANAISIVGALVAMSFAFHRRIALILGPASFATIVARHKKRPWRKEDVKSIVRVAIVDDNVSDFPAAELRGDGFSVRSYRQVKLSDFKELQGYDVVFLDMHGIVADDPEAGGLKLILRLREANPRQKICAVSSKTFDPTATTFFKQADDVKKKPMNAAQCREVILDLAGDAFDPEKLAQELDQLLPRVTFFQRRQVLREIDQILTRTTPLEELTAHDSVSRFASPTVMPTVRNLVRTLRHARK